MIMLLDVLPSALAPYRCPPKTSLPGKRSSWEKGRRSYRIAARLRKKYTKDPEEVARVQAKRLAE
jgi:hypothetical protein